MNGICPHGDKTCLEHHCSHGSTHPDRCWIEHLESKLGAADKLLTVARENEERTAAANRDLVSRLDKAEKRIALNEDYATSRLCPDHRGKWTRGRCVLCELERAERRLDAAKTYCREVIARGDMTDAFRIAAAAAAANVMNLLTDSVVERLEKNS